VFRLEITYVISGGLNRRSAVIGESKTVLKEGMMIRTRYIILAISLMLVSSASAEAQDSTMKRSHDPIQVPGELLGDLHGKPLDTMRLYASQKGTVKQIAFQIDERLADGTYILNLGDKKNIELANKQLDPQDFLVFRIGDTGGRVPKDKWPAPDGVEIELEDPLDGGRSYCYLISYSGRTPRQVEFDTVSLEHWDPWKAPNLPFIVKGYSYIIEGNVNKVGDRTYKTAINKNFTFPREAGGTGVNILDSMRVRAFTELFFGEVRIDVNETNIIGGIDAITEGMVRGYGRQWFTIALPMGLEGPRLYCDVFTYDRMVVSPIILKIPIDPKYIITRLGIELGYDLNENAYGMRFYSPNCMDGVTIDGKMTDYEKSLPDGYVPWYVITGPQGTLILRVHFDQSLLDQTESKLTFVDDLGVSFPPDDIPGSIGYQRTTVETASLQPGVYDMRVEWYFPPNFHRPDGLNREMLAEFLNIIDAPVVIHAGGSTAENRSVNPPPLVPRKR
jgi:hypothetical protein